MHLGFFSFVKSLIAISFLYSYSAGAWNSFVFDGLQGLDSKLRDSTPFTDSFEFSLWSSVRSRVYEPDRKELYLSSRYIRGDVRLSYKITQPESPSLFVYIPGIFNNVDGGQTKRAFERMSKLGPNILILPNPWGTDYLSSKPSHFPGDVVAEAKSLHELTQVFMSRMELPLDTKVYLYGASYGGFLAAIFANIDRDLGTYFVDREVYLFSPPLNMRKAINNLDELMFIDDFFNTKLSKADKGLIFLDYLFANDSSDLGTTSKIKSKDMTVRVGFKEALRESLRVAFTGHPAYDPHKKDYYFRSYIREIATDLEDLMNSPVAGLKYWVERGHSNHDSLDIKTLSTTNDFLNDYFYRASYPSESFWFFESGGHLGFIELPEFEMFLQTTKLEAR